MGSTRSFGSYLEDVDLGLRCVREDTGVFNVPDHRLASWQRDARPLAQPCCGQISKNQLLLVRRHYDRTFFVPAFGPSSQGRSSGLCRPSPRRSTRMAGGENRRTEVLSSRRRLHRSFARFSRSEREIHDRARDAYWRLYFRLTVPPSAQGRAD